MDEDKYNDWYQNNYDDLVQGFIEKMDDEFEEYAYDRYVTADEPDYDMMYESERDRKAEEESLK